MKSHILGIALLVIASYVQFTFSTSVAEYLTLTHDEKVALDKFKDIMRPHLYTGYMKEEIYLIRWLRAKNLNIPQAKQMLMDNLRWRKAQNIDTISKEDWSDFAEDYPYEIDTQDKEGRPVATAYVGSWNVRRAALAGKMPRLQRYMGKILEELTNNVIQGQYMGKNVTEMKMLINMEGFNILEHACPICLPFHTSFVNTYQNYYPGYTDAVILINTPPGFKVVLDVIQPILTSRTKMSLKIFGPEKSKWMKYLDEEISRNERTAEFGGTRS